MSTIKALVVDDSKIMRSSVKRALDQVEITDFEYIEAMDGEDALEKFDESIDMIFLDWNMPKMTGVELAREIRSQGFDSIPIIMVTAEKSMGKVDKALNEGGADEYITKPFTADKMLDVLRKFIDEEGKLKGGEEEKEEKSFFSGLFK